MNIVFLDRATIGPSVQFPKPAFNHKWTEYPQTTREQTIARLQGADVAITNKVIIDKAVLDACPTLQYIAVAATGMNVVDLNTCAERGITVANVSDYATHDVAEHAFMLMLALTKQVKAYSAALAQGQWQVSKQFCFFLEDQPPISTLRGKVLGIIGTGNIAQATAKIAKAFAMEVIYYSPSGRKTVGNINCVSLNTLLATSDIISIHCPLTEHTQTLIGEKQFALIKPSALLINTARGPIIDINALLNALHDNKLAGAGLDVLPEEPPTQDSAIMQALDNPRLIITPHTAWASHNAMQNLANQLIKKLEAFVAGKPASD